MLTIREEVAVTEAVEQAMTWTPFADDMMEAAKWRIAREPECGTLLGEHGDGLRRLMHMPSNATAKSPAMLVRYYVVEHMAVVDWIKFIPFNPNEAVSPDAYTL